MQVSSVLFHDFDYWAAHALAVKEWKRDTTSTLGMDHEQFVKSLFELVDIWYRPELNSA